MVKVRLFTSYFGNFRALQNEGVLMIGISRFPPKYFNGPTIFDLAPLASMLKLPAEEYDKQFAERVLGVTNPKNIIKQIEWYAEKTQSTSIALCCYEKEQKECHRYNVALWLQEAGFEIEEFKVETKIEPEKPKVQDLQTSMFD